MLRSVDIIRGYKLSANDGEIGKVKDFLFDDRSWDVRYVVVDTGGWLTERKVLLAPDSFTDIDFEGKHLTVNLNKEQIENSPEIDSHKPVSRQHEVKLYEYYGWTPYWGAPIQTHGIGVAPPAAAPAGMPSPQEREEGEKGDPHLRSVREVEGYDIHTLDNRIGHVEEFVVDTERWRLRYMVVDTRDFWPGKKVLVAPEWIKGIDWSKSEVAVDLKKETIKSAPEYDHDKPVSREYEENLYAHYGRQGYWKK